MSAHRRIHAVPRDRFDHFAMLVRAIVFQQLSTKAATTIHNRLVSCMPDGKPTPAALATVTDEQLRAAGLSRQKATYLRDLCEKVRTGAVPLENIDSLADEEVITALTTIKGIGRWTAEMFLIFRLQRPDVLPVGDLGIMNAMQKPIACARSRRPNGCGRSAKPGRGPLRSGPLMLTALAPAVETEERAVEQVPKIGTREVWANAESW